MRKVIFKAAIEKTPQNKMVDIYTCTIYYHDEKTNVFTIKVDYVKFIE